MHRLILISLCFLLSASPAKAALNVLTTTADLKSITEFIGGDRVKVESLGRGDQNYHFLQAKPSYMIRARKADLFISNGLELEIGYQSLILEGSRNPNIQPGRPGYLDASAGITPLEIPEAVDRSLGDIHPSGNPHYWLDPVNIKIVATNIARKLGELSPSDTGYFMDNLQTFNAQMDRKLAEWKALLAPYRGEKIVTYHKTWSYFAQRFGLEIAGQMEPKPGIPPSPGHLRDVVELVPKEGIKVILNESIYTTNAADYVAQKTGVNVVIAPISVGGIKEAPDYFALMDIIVNGLKEGFRK